MTYRSKPVLTQLLVVFISLFVPMRFLCGQGLTGPETAETGMAQTYIYSDDVIIAEPQWATTDAQIRVYVSGIRYSAEIVWGKEGIKTLEFRDGTRVLSSIQVQVTKTCGPPQAPDAGRDQFVCGLTSTTLTSVLPDGLRGMWTIVQGTGGRLVSPSAPGTVFTGMTGGSYTLRWTVTDGSCGSAYDDVAVMFLPKPERPSGLSGSARFGAGPFLLKVAPPAGSDQTVHWFTPDGIRCATGLSYQTPVISESRRPFGHVRIMDGRGCLSDSLSIGLHVEPLPQILSDRERLVLGKPVRLSSGKPYRSYQWTDALGNVLSNSDFLQVRQAGTYRVAVTLNEVEGSGTSGPFRVLEQFSDAVSNRVITEVIPRSGIADDAFLDTVSRRAQHITYLDGLGRSREECDTQASPSGKDIHRTTAYDRFGRTHQIRLPVASGSDGFMLNTVAGDKDGTADAVQRQYADPTDDVADDPRPFQEILFEPSPLDRVSESFGEGAAWMTDRRSRSIRHLVNLRDDFIRVPIWKIHALSGLPVLDDAEPSGFYPAGTLRITEERDEQGRTTRSHRDRAGRLILRQIQTVDAPDESTADDWAQTAYVYDGSGRLRWVLQPVLMRRLMSENRNPSAPELASLAFQYRYDPLGRLVMKQEPGRDSVLMVYDDRDRLVLMQDGNQRAAVPYRWTFFKYDRFNRPVSSGIKDTTALLSQRQMQWVVDDFYRTRPWAVPYEEVTGDVKCHGYSNRSYPVVTTSNRLEPDRYLTVSYYDDYRFLNTWPAEFRFSMDQISGQAPVEKRTIGLATGGKEKVLDGGIAGGHTWLRHVRYYDEYEREIQRIGDNYKGGTDIVTRIWDFTGRVVRERHQHQEADVTWRDVIGLTPLGNKVVRGQSAAGWSAGATSVQQLGAGKDGWMEFTANTPAQQCAGWSDVNSNTAYTTLDYAICLQSNGTISIYEQASGKYVVANAGEYRSGDVFRIQRVAGVVRYFRNGEPIHTSTTPSASPLMADVSLHGPETSLSGFRSSFSTTKRDIHRRFRYDHAGRLTAEWHQVDAGPEILLTDTRYNEIGQVVNRKLHIQDGNAATARQSVDYRYHIRGWLRSLNSSRLMPAAGEASDLFGMELDYESVEPGLPASTRFDGVVSAAEFSRYLGQASIARTATLFSYDPQVRLRESRQWNSLADGKWMSGKGGESVSSYDLNGNVLQLRRESVSGASSDELSYRYPVDQPNRLAAVRDDAPSSSGRSQGFNDGHTGEVDFTYDRNGNIQTDLNRGIVAPIAYNILDLPEVIRRGENRLHLIYSATGTLLSQVSVYSGASNAAPAAVRQVDRCGPFVYDQDMLQRIDHGQGRVIFQNSSIVYQEAGTRATAYVATNANVSSVVQNGIDRYVSVTSTSAQARSGVMAAGGIAVQAGDRFLIRLAGYRLAGTARTSNPVYLNVKLNGADMIWPGAAMPADVSGEHRVEQMVVAAASGTMTLGVQWGSQVLSGEVFYINDLEVIRINPAPAEYQYFLRDHQQNVRVTFTADPKTDAAQATLETVASAAERTRFLRFDHARRVNSALLDRTNGKTTGMAARLNGSSNERYGLAMSLSVMPGDVVSAEVYAKFIDQNPVNWTSALTTLMSQVTAGRTSVVTDGSAYTSSTGSFLFGGLNPTSGVAGSGPRFYLNWLVFDRNQTLIQGLSGFTRLSSAPREFGQDVPHERMSMPPITITEPGFVYVYVSNEEQTPVEVYYDDFRVAHRQSAVLQMIGYHPFGSVSSYDERENLIPQPVLFGSREIRRELGLEDYDFGARWFSPSLGRTWQADPLAAHFDRWSPYVWAGDDPFNNVDPDGRDWYRANGSDGRMDPNGEVIWQAGSGSMKGYTNIGSRFTFSVAAPNGASVSYTFDQLEFVERTETVMATSGWMTQNPATNPRGCKTCCYKVSRDMVEASGVKLANAYSPASVTLLEEASDGSGDQSFRKRAGYQRGLQLINAALDAGKPVVVGVDHSAGARNVDGVTDHFIVIAGRITDIRTGAVSYRYFDPGNWRSEQGAAANNILRNQDGFYKSDHYFRGTEKSYTLTHVVQ